MIYIAVGVTVITIVIPIVRSPQRVSVNVRADASPLLTTCFLEAAEFHTGTGAVMA